MALAELDISLRIKNNRDYPQQANVMGNPANLLDTSNSTTEYRWDITSLVLTNENTVSLQYKETTALDYSTYVNVLGGNTNQSIIDALNLLLIGTFSLYEELGQTYVSTYNEVFAFGQLDVYYVPPPPPPDTPATAILTQNNDVLTTESGDILLTQ